MTKTVVIVGGGSAGWLTAGIIAARHNPQNDAGQGTKVILLESPDVANLGVGEGTWPTMRDTLRQIGISEVDFLRSCDVGFKQGSQFINWQRGEGESYYHPFAPPAGYGSVNLAAHWLDRGMDSNFAMRFLLRVRSVIWGLLPKPPRRQNTPLASTTVTTSMPENLLNC